MTEFEIVYRWHGTEQKLLRHYHSYMEAIRRGSAEVRRVFGSEAEIVSIHRA